MSYKIQIFGSVQSLHGPLLLKTDVKKFLTGFILQKAGIAVLFFGGKVLALQKLHIVNLKMHAAPVQSAEEKSHFYICLGLQRYPNSSKYRILFSNV